MRTETAFLAKNLYCRFEKLEQRVLAVNQFTVVEGNQNKRQIYPVCKRLAFGSDRTQNAVDENANLKSAFNQLQPYKQAIFTVHL